MASAPKKILFVRLSALGDVIQTIPILPMVRESYPDSVIGWAIDAELAPMLAGHPDLDYVHLCHRRQWFASLKNPLKWRETAREMRLFAEEIRDVGYDVVLDLQGLAKTGVIAALSGAKRRIGFAHNREFTNIFYNETYLNLKEYFDPSVFHLAHMRTLAKAIGCPELEYKMKLAPIPDLARQRVRRAKDNAFKVKAPLIALAFATQWESKHWPRQYWIELIHRILVETKYNIVIVGSKADAGEINEILSHFNAAELDGRVLNLAGMTSINELGAVYEDVSVAIGSDSAPLHIAGAMETPHLIGIYGPTGKLRTPPIGSPDIKIFSSEGELDCQPCHKRICPLGTTECMARVKPEMIFNHLVNILG